MPIDGGHRGRARSGPLARRRRGRSRRRRRRRYGFGLGLGRGRWRGGGTVPGGGSCRLSDRSRGSFPRPAPRGPRRRIRRRLHRRRRRRLRRRHPARAARRAARSARSRSRSSGERSRCGGFRSNRPMRTCRPDGRASPRSVRRGGFAPTMAVPNAEGYLPAWHRGVTAHRPRPHPAMPGAGERRRGSPRWRSRRRDGPCAVVKRSS